MSFSQERAFLNHSVFKNDFLSRLTRRMDVITDRTMAFTDRVSAAAQFLLKSSSLTKNTRRAIQVWSKDPDGALSARIAALLSKAQSLGPLHPTSRFNQEKTECLEQLARMDTFVRNLENLLSEESRQRETGVIQFWRDALRTHDFLADLDPSSPMFWDYFSISENPGTPGG